jgi:hypothetical protein
MYLRYKTKGNVTRRIRFDKSDLGPPIGRFWSCLIREDKEVLGVRKNITHSKAIVHSVFTEEARELVGEKLLESIQGDDCIWSMVERPGLYTILVLARGRITELPKFKKSIWCREEAVFAVRCSKHDLARWGIKPPGPTVTQPSL